MCTSAPVVGLSTPMTDSKTARRLMHMERQMLNTGEYILLRGKDSYNGLLQRVETNPVSRITGRAIMDLYNSVPKSYRKNAVFLMNTVTLNELSRSLGVDRNLLSSRDDGTFVLMDQPIVLCNAMPFISKGSVPILFGDFGKVSIEDQETARTDLYLRIWVDEVHAVHSRRGALVKLTREVLHGEVLLACEVALV